MSRGLGPWRWLLAGCGLAWLAARLLGWPVPQAACGVLLVNLLPGLAVLRLLGMQRRAVLWLLVAAGVLSPPLLAGALTLASRLAGLRLEGAVWPLLVLCAAVVAWPERTKEGGEPPAVPESARSDPADRVALALGVALAGVVALGLLNPRLARWSDSWYHAAVFNNVVRGGVPPDFPHFAGHALPAPWFFYAYLVGCRGIVHADPFVLMALLNVWVGLLWAGAIYLVARAAGLTGATARWSSLAGVLGVNPLGPALLVLRAVTGATHGLPVLRASLSNANAVIIGLAFRFPEFQASLLGRLWTPTAFNFGLLLVALAAMTLLETWERPRPGPLVVFTLALTLLFHWHTLTSFHLVLGLGTAVAVGAAALARRDMAAAARKVAVFGGAVLLAWLIAYPYLRSVTVGAPGAQMMVPRFIALNGWGFVLSLGPVALAALLGVGGLAHGRRPVLVGLALGLLVPFLFFDLPGAADEKLYYPLFVVLAAASGAGVAAAWRRSGLARLAVAGLVVLGLGNAAITARGFLGDRRPLREMFDAAHLERAAFLTPDEAAALRWVRERSPEDAVFLQSPRSQGTEPIMVFGARRLFLGAAESFYRATFFPRADQPPAAPRDWRDLQHRKALQAAVFSERSLAQDTLAMLKSYPWPLFVWWDAGLGGGSLSPTLCEDPAAAREVFASPTVRVLEVLPAAR